MAALKVGDSGDAVRRVQEILVSKGYMIGTIDGKFGPRTKHAVMTFQARNGLTPDGMVGVRTLLTLRESKNPIGRELEGRGQTIIPMAEQMPFKMKTKGKYSKGYPKGAVVHFDASHWKTDDNTRNVMKYGKDKGYAYLEICYSGRILQAHPVNEWGNHGGVSGWKGLVGNVSDDLIGIEMANPGKLELKNGRYVSWYGESIPGTLVRHVTEAEYGCPTGYYMKYSEEQEKSLIKLLIWLKLNDPYGVFSFDNTVGHHECAGKLGIGYFRKPDPGGALSVPMPKLREILKKSV